MLVFPGQGRPPRRSFVRGSRRACFLSEKPEMRHEREQVKLLGTATEAAMTDEEKILESGCKFNKVADLRGPALSLPSC
jgi:hypothetical protein